MYCIERPARPVSWHARRHVGWPLLWVAVASLIAGCAGQPPPPPAPRQPSQPAPAAPTTVRPVPAPANRALGAPDTPRSLAQLKAQAAQRIVAASPGMTYGGKVPDVLLAIPVLEVELNADGSVRRVDVLRPPRQAPDTVQLAIDAVKRAAPFGDVSRLPRPWKFTETFLFNDERKFKPRSMDE